jgi:hypothetical protein
MHAQMPDGFPVGIHADYRYIENWSRMLRVNDVLTARPTNEEQCLQIVRWAAAAGWRVRPMGALHTWVPILLQDADRTVLIDQSAMTGLVAFTEEPVPAVTLHAGTTLADATAILEGIDNGGRSSAPGWGWPDFPGIPDVTVAGMCAIGAHGAGIRMRTDQEDLFGTVSNLILGFRAIVSEGDRYVVRDFTREDPDASAFLVHLGHAYLLQLCMRVVPNCTLARRVEYPAWTESFAEPSSSLPPQSLQALVEEHGRVQQLWFPFTQTPIVQHFSEEPHEPAAEVIKATAPLTVRLSPTLPVAFTTAFGATLKGLPWLTPLVERTTLVEMRHLSPPDHVWHGTSRNVLLYVQHDTLRVISLAYAILVEQHEVQAAVHALGHKFDDMLHHYARSGLEPINSCLEIRVTDLDRADAVGLPGAAPAVLSPARALPGAALDRAVWFDLVTVPGSSGLNTFCMEFEAWLWETFASPGTLRAEWSKAWAFGPDGPWTNTKVIDRVLRSYDPDGSLTTAHAMRDTWRRYDTAGVYGSAVMSRVFDAS